MSDEEDLLGGAPLTRAERRKRNLEAAKDIVDLDVPVSGGVSVFWLAKAFGLDSVTVRKKIADAPTFKRRKGGYLYDLKVVAPYLVKPRGGLEEMLRDMKPADLPTRLQAAFWDARLKQQRWEEAAKDLWRTEAVMEALGQVFQAVKFTVQLWPDQVERAVGLTEEQREMLTEMGDQLQNEVHRVVLEAAKANLSPTNFGVLEGKLEAPDEDDEEEDLL